MTLGASTRLHDQVFAKVLRSPMSFFDTTPVGRILNRFSKDLDDGMWFLFTISNFEFSFFLLLEKPKNQLLSDTPELCLACVSRRLP